MTGRFYIYCFYDRLGDPAYVGKGAGNGINTHQPAARAYKRDGCWKVFSTPLQRAMVAGVEFGKRKVFDDLDEQWARELEYELIELIGRIADLKGPLLNK